MTYNEYLQLIAEALEHDRLYYVEAKPVISDYEYDLLLKRIEQVEKAHPEWVFEKSPTQKVSSDGKSGFKEVLHSQPMLSLLNTYSEGELRDFTERMERLLERVKPTFHSELKIDGIAVSLRFEKGHFVQGVTRGDGKKGDDITENIRTIENLPKKLEGEVPEFLEVRGEVFMPRLVFQELNVAKVEAGEDVYANPRNAASGSLKLLDASETKERRLSLFVYDIVEPPSEITLQSEIAPFLHKLGLPSFPKDLVSTGSSVKDILAFAHKIEEKRPDFPFEIDGIVVKLNELKERRHVGFTGKSPKWAVAYKFAPEQAITVIEEITVQVGRTGVLTPVAELKPVLLAGSTISRATLHNEEEIERKDIRIGDTVIIEKGGDVIPKVVSVDFSKRGDKATKWVMPTSCPICEGPVTHQIGEVAHRCNNEDCPARASRRIIYFASKDAMDIDNLGEKVAIKLMEKGFVKRISDIYRLTKEELSTLEGFKEKSVHNLLSAIEASKKPTLARFIFALGIKHVGEGTAELLAERSETIENFTALQEEDLLSIEGIGPKVALAVLEFLADKKNQKEILDLLSLGVTPQKLKQKAVGHAFSGKTFVLTGTLQNYSRSEASLLIKERGGKVASAVSKETDYLLAGEDSGSKYTKAQKLHVPILSEPDFVAML